MNEVPIVYFIIDTDSIIEENKLNAITSAILISKSSFFKHWRLNIIDSKSSTDNILAIPDENITSLSSIFHITSNKNVCNKFEKFNNQNIWNTTIIIDNHLKTIESQNHWGNMKVLCPIFLPEILSAIITASVNVPSAKSRWLDVTAKAGGCG